MWPCRVCGGVQVDDHGYCVRCRSFVGNASGRPAVRPPVKGSTPAVIVVIVIALVMAVLCCAGIGVVAWRRASSSAVEVPAPTRAPSADSYSIELARVLA